MSTVESGEDGNIKKSREYYCITDVGDDDLYFCDICSVAHSAIKTRERGLCIECLKFLSDHNFKKGLEIGHTFYFGTSFSDHFGSAYVNKDCKRTSLHMSSYGIGISRIFAILPEIIDKGSAHLCWPVAVAPYRVCVITPKVGSPEEVIVKLILPELYDLLDSIPTLRNEVVVDDLDDNSIGKRLRDAKMFGFPYIIVAGHDCLNDIPLFELFDVNNDKQYLMPKSSLIQFLIDATNYLSDEKRRREYLAANS